MAWTTQLADGYLDNTGTVSVGSETVDVSQQFSYQDSSALSEIVAKVSLANRGRGTEYKFDYLQRVSGEDINC